MRQIATLPEDAARTFADYLLTLHIQTQLQREGDGFAVWVCDEDRVPQARQELAAFTSNPANDRYRAASPVAESLRREEAHLEADYARRQRRLLKQMQGLGAVRRPVTVALIAVSVVVTLASNFGTQNEPLLQRLYISSYRVEDGMVFWPFLNDIRSGQVWRLVSPIFIHLGPVHLIFNMLALLYLGGQIESRRASVRFVLLVLVSAVVSNLCQYYFGASTFLDWRLTVRPSPLFGGMSGVCYALFGYAWVKTRFAPGLGIHVSRENVVIMVGWFFLCFVPDLFPGRVPSFIPRVANVAHASGLLLGLALGYAPVLWGKLRRRDQLDV
jgi:GlpG protein